MTQREINLRIKTALFGIMGPFADIPGLAGTPYVDGWGDDGFGGSGGGGGGGGGGGRGRDYSAFWKPILDAASKGETDNIPGLTATGTTRYYDYSNLSGSGMFETPNNDGVYTEQVGEMYHFIGASDKTSYEMSSYYGDENNQGSNGWQTASMINEAASFSFETTVQFTEGAQQLANRYGGTSSKILTGGEVAEGIGKGFAILSAGITVSDGIKNGWKPHHTADLVVDATLYTVAASVPVAGWIAGGIWFVGDLISEHLTGKSITENIFDDGE